MFIYKEKCETPEFVIELNEADIKRDSRKANKFSINTSSHKGPILLNLLRP